MRIHVIACRVLSRELNFLAATSPNVIDITWLPQGLHDTPDALRRSIAEALKTLEDDVQSGALKHRPDAFALGYGLCSNGVVGLEAGTIPLVVPRTDDCIALFLGSQARYMALFETMNGTYWYNNGWIECCGRVMDAQVTREARWQRYAERYGEDNADYLIETEDGWAHNYNTAAFIRSPVYHNPDYEAETEGLAREKGWEFASLEGEMRLLKALTDGRWDDAEFLVCPPGYRVAADYSGAKMRAVPVEGRQAPC